MRKTLLLVILLFSLFLVGCGKLEKEKKSQDEHIEYMTTNCDMQDMVGVINDNFRRDTKVYAAVYLKGTPVEEGRYSVAIYDSLDGSKERVVLQGKEEKALYRLTVLENGHFKALLLVWDVESNSCTSLWLQIYDQQGKLLEEQDISTLINDFVTDIVFPESFLLDSKGDLYFYTTTYHETTILSKVYCLNNDGEVKLIKEFEGKVLTLENVSSEVWLSTANQEDEVRFFKLGISETEIEQLDVVWNLSAESFFIVDGLADAQKFIVQKNTVYKYDLTSGNHEQLFTYEDVGLEGGLINTGKLVATGQDEFYIPSKITVNEEGKRVYDWVKITKSATDSNKEILTIAVAEESSYLKDAVVAFNKSSDTYKVEIKVYEKDASNNQSSQLQGDIAAGRIPDMISTDLMELDLLINKGMAQDLTNLLEADADLSKEAFVARSLEIYQRGDGLYAIPRNISVLALTSREELLPGRNSWSLQEFEDYVKTLPNPQAATNGISQNNMLQAMLELYAYRFVDWEQRTCTFESKEFAELLQFISKYPRESLSMETDIGKLVEALQTDEVILYIDVMSGLDNHQMLKELWGAELQWVGFPTEQGSGVQLMDLDTPLVIMESSSHKEEMWEILKYMITNPRLAESGIPAYKPLFDKACTLAMEKTMIESEDGSMKEQPKMEMEIEGLKIEIYALTEKDIQDFEELLERAEPVKTSSQVIKNIIMEEASVYFSGQKSVEEVSEIIQNRVELYLNES